MGTWGNSNFDSDAALDFLNELNVQNIIQALTQAFELQIDYIDDEQGSRTLAAAEILAAAKDKNISRIPQQAQPLVRKLTPTTVMCSDARQAVNRIMQSSETKELHAELPMEEYAAWENSLKSLIQRLN
jgi:hypothetical protein